MGSHCATSFTMDEWNKVAVQPQGHKPESWKPFTRRFTFAPKETYPINNTTSTLKKLNIPTTNQPYIWIYPITGFYCITCEWKHFTRVTFLTLSKACHGSQDQHTILPWNHRGFMVQWDASIFLKFLHQRLDRALSSNTNDSDVQ